MIQIAHIESLYPTKFGVPRQSGIVDAPARVVFEPEYRVPEAVRGLEDFDYVWLIWQFHLAEREGWSPTVRPPRLGGNKRMGVFATRSPFRPNAIGLSSVRLLRVEQDAKLGPVLYVEGADLVDGTPIFDIKPYLPYADSHPDARGGFAQEAPGAMLAVDDPDGVLDTMDDDVHKALIDTLRHDPRPRYQHDPERVYAMPFADGVVRFRVDGERAIIVKKC
ncbi:MAG: tRNA (N6-threonylcarbamoyladenosine(37)-N6)-methyltransferase TrmO [Bacteroidales bacterium]|nr:tRNA (N6-threonylcarbamoyladenosine(37)-N6)-methyltransferase TrmO [Bacteroidales bacterium]